MYLKQKAIIRSSQNSNKITSTTSTERSLLNGSQGTSRNCLRCKISTNQTRPACATESTGHLQFTFGSCGRKLGRLWWPRRSLSDSRFPIAYSHSALRIPIYHSGFAFGIADSRSALRIPIYHSGFIADSRSALRIPIYHSGFAFSHSGFAFGIAYSHLP